MSTASIIAIADAIVTKLNSVQVVVAPAVSPFSPFTFTAVREYAPTYRLEDMDTLHVVVCPRSKTTTMNGRANSLQDDVVDVGIMQRPSDTSKTTLDALMLLVEQIADVLDFTEFGGSAWQASANEPVFAPEHLREWKQFSSVLSITVRRIR